MARLDFRDSFVHVHFSTLLYVAGTMHSKKLYHRAVLYSSLCSWDNIHVCMLLYICVYPRLLRMCYYFRGIPLEGFTIMHSGHKEGPLYISVVTCTCMCSEIIPSGARRAELPTQNACACGCQLHPKGKGFSIRLTKFVPCG